MDVEKSKQELLQEVEVLRVQVRELEGRLGAGGGKQTAGPEDSWRKIGQRGAREPNLPKISLYDSEEKYRALIETTDTGFVILDPEGRVLSANAEYVRVSGHEQVEEILGRSVVEWTAPHDRERNAQEIKKCLELGSVRNLDLDYAGRDGGIVPVEMNATVVMTESGVEILSVCRDVGARRRAERELEETKARYEELIERMDEGLAVADQDFRFTFVNRRMAEMLGVSRQELVGRLMRDLVTGEYRDVVDEQLAKRRAGKEESYELAWGTKLGKVVYTLVTPRGLYDRAGRFAGGFAVVTDITERKKSEAALRASEERYRVAALMTGHLIYDYDCETGSVKWAGAIEAITGYKADEFVDFGVREWMERIHSDERSHTIRLVKWALAAGKSVIMEYRLRRKDGTYVWVEDNGSFLLNEKGRAYRMLGAMKDISERKRAEERLQASEARYRRVVEAMGEGLAITDRNFLFTFVNRALCDMLGYSREQLLGHHVREFVHEEYLATVDQQMERRRGGEEEAYELGWKNKANKVVHSLITPTVFYDEEGKFAGALGLVLDFTERKHMEEALRESEERLALALSASGQGLYDLDVTTGKVVISREYAEMLEYSPDDYCITPDLWKPQVHPEDREEAVKRFESYLEGTDRPYKSEYRMRTKSGGWRWILSIGEIVRKDEAGRPLRMVGIHQDISDRKRAEEALRLTQLSVDQAADGVQWISPEGRFVYVNERACRMLGYSQEELLELAVWNMSPDCTPEAFRERFAELKKVKSWLFETRHRRKDGSIFPVEVSGRYIAFGAKEFYFAFVRDITERKRMEEKLRESEERFRSIVEHSHAGIFMVDERFRFAYVNQRSCELCGYLPEEMIGEDFRRFLVDESQERISENYLRRQGGETLPDRSEFTFVRKDGEVRVAELNATVIMDRAGRKRTVGQVLDITERKRMEEELRESEERFRDLSEAAFEGIAISHNGILQDANSRFAEMFGCSSEALPGRNMMEFIAPESQELVTQRIRDGQLEQYELMALRSDGTTFPVEVQARAMRHKGLQVRVTAIRDITDRKMTEEQLKEKNLDLEEMNATLKVLLAQRDKDRTEMEERILFNLKEMVDPYLRRLLKSGLNEKQMSYVGVVESNLRDIVSPFGQRLSLSHLNLTVNEMQIANLIRQGRSTKEIGDILNLSPKTVETHRRKIREKIRIVNRKVNLRAYLMSLEKGSRRALGGVGSEGR